MAGQKSFIAKTIGWTLLMIAAMSVSFIGFIFIMIDGPQVANYYLILLAVVAGLAVAAYSVKQIILAEQAWKAGVIEEVLADPSQVIIHWKYPSEQWHQFKEAYLADKRKTPRTVSITVMIVLVVGFAIGYFYEGGDSEVLQILAPLIPLIGGAVWWIANTNVSLIQKAYNAQKNGEVILSAKGAIVNKRHLIPFSFFGGGLEDIKVSEMYDMPVLHFTTYVNTNDSTAYHDHYILIPAGEEAQAADAVEQLEEAFGWED